MVNIKVNDIVYDIPESWDDVSINKWRSLRNIQRYIKEDMTDDEKFNIDIEIISVLTDIDFETLIKFPGEYYSKLLDLIQFYSTTKLKEEPAKSFTIDDKEYKLIDLNKLTLGDRANIDIIRDSDSLEDRIGRVMSILYRYDDEPDLESEERDEKESLFNEKVSINSVYATMGFFLYTIEMFNSHMEYSLVQKKMRLLMMKMSWMKRFKMKIRSVIHNITMAWRIGYLRGTYYVLRKFSK